MIAPVSRRGAVLKGSAVTVAAGAVAASVVAHAKGDDSEVISLLNEWRRLGDELDALTGERMNERMTAIFDKIDGVEDALARMPAHSTEAVLGKLEIVQGWVDSGAPDNGIDQRLLASAMKDLAMIGGAS